MASHEFFEQQRFERVTARGQHGLNRAVGQNRREREAQAGAREHFDALRAYGFGQILAAKINGVLQPLPTARDELGISRGKARAGVDLAVF